MRFRRIMIFGIGVVGGHLTDLLSRAPEDYEIVVVARDEQRLRERINLAITVAMKRRQAAADPLCHRRPGGRGAHRRAALTASGRRS